MPLDTHRDSGKGAGHRRLQLRGGFQVAEQCAHGVLGCGRSLWGLSWDRQGRGPGGVRCWERQLRLRSLGPQLTGSSQPLAADGHSREVRRRACWASVRNWRSLTGKRAWSLAPEHFLCRVCYGDHLTAPPLTGGGSRYDP